MNYTTTRHMFSSHDTIEAAIRKFNNYTRNRQILDELLIIYKQLNGNTVPRLCDVVLIPVMVQENK